MGGDEGLANGGVRGGIVFQRWQQNNQIAAVEDDVGEFDIGHIAVEDMSISRGHHHEGLCETTDDEAMLLTDFLLPIRIACLLGIAASFLNVESYVV